MARTPPQIYWANLLLEKITPQTTNYRHTTGPVVWGPFNDQPQYLSITDCSGFVTALLKQSYGLSEMQFTSIIGVKRPYARTYYAAILNQRSFIRITSIFDVFVGDFIAIRYPNSVKGQNTGHIMLINDLPKQMDNQRNLRTYAVRIVDQSGTHGSDDTRSAQKYSGLGSGDFRIYTNDQGIPTGYSWSTSSTSRYISVEERPLVFGRFTPYQ